MSLEQLKSTKNRNDLARLLGYKRSALVYILYKIPDTKKYTEFTVPKSSGGSRKINAPVSHLKLMQSRLADLLNVCFEEIHKGHNPRRALSHGFRNSYSINTNARNHTNKRYVFNIDLKDFFPSINFGRVRGYFIKSEDFELTPEVATVIARIACHKNELPQGSPVSPVISNLIGHMLDIRLVRLAKKAKCTYSRYVDDITFSTNQKEFPSLIARETESGKWIPSDKLTSTVERAGFKVNLKKVSMQYRINQQVVTGLVVNKKVNIRASYYRQVRAMCNSLFQTGEFYFGQEMRKGKLANSSTSLYGSVNQLRGVLHYIYGIKRVQKHKTIENQTPTSIKELCRRLLYFDKFHNLEFPLVICEGKTDSVYIKCALKAYSDEYYSMIENSESILKWKVNFFNYSQFSQEFTPFSGGTGGFSKFINCYQREMDRFQTQGRSFPVILLVDNDSGGKDVMKAAKKFGVDDNEGKKEFYHLIYNLYLVVLPPSNEKEDITIEDYFDLKTKERILKGKTFQPNQNFFDKDKNYGKHIFADKVVKPNQELINFSAFKPLLERLDAAILDYQSKKNFNAKIR